MDHPLTDRQPKIIFIGGTGRSGTNISKDILAQHPQVAALPFEYRFIIDPDGLADFYRSYTASWSPYLADRRLKRLERLLNTLAAEPWWHKCLGTVIRAFNKDAKTLSPRRYHRWQLQTELPNFKQHVDELMWHLLDFTFPAAWVGTESYALHPHIYHAGPKSRSELAALFSNFINAVIGDFLAQRQKTVYVEDNTWNILFVRELFDFVPTAKLLHIYRDPRDVVASFMHQRWTPTEAAQAAEWYRSIMNHWFSVKKTLLSESYYEFSLETLVAAPQEIVSALYEFAGLDGLPNLTGLDLGKSNAGRWRRDLSPTEQKTVQTILKDIIQELGYD